MRIALKGTAIFSHAISAEGRFRTVGDDVDWQSLTGTGDTGVKYFTIDGYQGANGYDVVYVGAISTGAGLEQYAIRRRTWNGAAGANWEQLADDQDFSCGVPEWWYCNKAANSTYGEFGTTEYVVSDLQVKKGTNLSSYGDDLVRAVGRSGVVLSIDGGANWGPDSDDLGATTNRAVDFHGGRLFVGNTDWVGFEMDGLGTLVDKQLSPSTTQNPNALRCKAPPEPVFYTQTLDIVATDTHVYIGGGRRDAPGCGMLWKYNRQTNSYQDIHPRQMVDPLDRPRPVAIAEHQGILLVAFENDVVWRYDGAAWDTEPVLYASDVGQDDVLDAGTQLVSLGDRVALVASSDNGGTASNGVWVSRSGFGQSWTKIASFVPQNGRRYGRAVINTRPNSTGLLVGTKTRAVYLPSAFTTSPPFVDLTSAAPVAGLADGPAAMASGVATHLSETQGVFVATNPSNGNPAAIRWTPWYALDSNPTNPDWVDVGD